MANKKEKTASMAAKRRAGNIVAYIILILMSIIWLFPFVGIVLQSFRSFDTEYGGMVNYLVPKQFSLDNYKFLFSGETNFLLWYMNTIIIAFFVSLFQTCVILCVSYALSRMRFKCRDLLIRCPADIPRRVKDQILQEGRVIGFKIVLQKSFPAFAVHPEPRSDLGHLLPEFSNLIM